MKVSFLCMLLILSVSLAWADPPQVTVYYRGRPTLCSQYDAHLEVDGRPTGKILTLAAPGGLFWVEALPALRALGLEPGFNSPSELVVGGKSYSVRTVSFESKLMLSNEELFTLGFVRSTGAAYSPDRSSLTIRLARR